MAKDIIPKLESLSDWKLPVLLLLYTVAIAAFPHEALVIGGILFWIALLYKWLVGGCPV